MAWRIDESVVRGEIDNRVKGVVRGRLWLEGVEKPMRGAERRARRLDVTTDETARAERRAPPSFRVQGNKS